MHVNKILSKDFKGVRWMPWRYQPKKDAVSCDKLRRDASNLWPVDFRMGEPGSGYALSPIEYEEGTWGTETSNYPEEK